MKKSFSSVVFILAMLIAYSEASGSSREESAFLVILNLIFILSIILTVILIVYWWIKKHEKTEFPSQIKIKVAYSLMILLSLVFISGLFFMFFMAYKMISYVS